MNYELFSFFSERRAAWTAEQDSTEGFMGSTEYDPAQDQWVVRRLGIDLSAPWNCADENNIHFEMSFPGAVYGVVFLFDSLNI